MPARKRATSNTPGRWKKAKPETTPPGKARPDRNQGEHTICNRIGDRLSDPVFCAAVRRAREDWRAQTGIGRQPHRSNGHPHNTNGCGGELTAAPNRQRMTIWGKVPHPTGGDVIASQPQMRPRLRGLARAHRFSRASCPWQRSFCGSLSINLGNGFEFSHNFFQIRRNSPRQRQRMVMLTAT